MRGPQLEFRDLGSVFDQPLPGANSSKFHTMGQSRICKVPVSLLPLIYSLLFGEQ
jgi:hypothetical protein